MQKRGEISSLESLYQTPYSNSFGEYVEKLASKQKPAGRRVFVLSILETPGGTPETASATTLHIHFPISAVHTHIAFTKLNGVIRFEASQSAKVICRWQNRISQFLPINRHPREFLELLGGIRLLADEPALRINFQELADADAVHVETRRSEYVIQVHLETSRMIRIGNGKRFPEFLLQRNGVGAFAFNHFKANILQNIASVFELFVI
jgi:hypothetical protein